MVDQVQASNQDVDQGHPQPERDMAELETNTPPTKLRQRLSLNNTPGIGGVVEAPGESDQGH